MTSISEVMPDVGGMNASEAPTSEPTVVVQDGSPERLIEAVSVMRATYALTAEPPPPTVTAPSAAAIIMSLAESACEAAKLAGVGGALGLAVSAIDACLDRTDAAATDLAHALFGSLELFVQLAEAKSGSAHPTITAMADRVRAVLHELRTR